MTDDWHPVATLLRSQCHDRTWVGHVEGATFSDTPAGPLAVVEHAVEEMAGGARARWRHLGDTWVLEVKDRW